MCHVEALSPQLEGACNDIGTSGTLVQDLLCISSSPHVSDHPSEERLDAATELALGSRRRHRRIVSGRGQQLGCVLGQASMWLLFGESLGELPNLNRCASAATTAICGTSGHESVAPSDVPCSLQVLPDTDGAGSDELQHIESCVVHSLAVVAIRIGRQFNACLPKVFAHSRRLNSLQGHQNGFGRCTIEAKSLDRSSLRLRTQHLLGNVACKMRVRLHRLVAQSTLHRDQEG
mmetsp:Transcript_98871/g.265527  ORF Transcript_98871/g.265527 Transcript_98871/m.265527 type:complete len:233 (-) Transcript_98871:643-1341(-)